MISFRTVEIPVGTIMNFDIFYWSLLAEHVFVKTNFMHIMPGGENILKYLYIDGWGSSFLLAFMSKLIHKTSIETTTYYTIFFLTLINLTIFELIQKIFHFRNKIAFTLTFLTAGNTFLFFIAYNQFNSEIAATFYYLVSIFVLIHLSTQRQLENNLKNILMMLFPLLGILLTYQSGFLVFSSFLIIFGLISTFFIDPPFHFKKMLMRSHLLLITIIAIFFILVLLPEFAFHTVNRTFFVLQTLVGGWQMPLLSPFILFSIPELGVLPEGLNIHLMRYAGMITFLLLLLFLACKISYRLTHDLYKNFMSLVLFFCFSLLSYFLLYSIKGDAYQVWKFAGFTVLPISFIFLSVLISPFYYSKNNSALYQNILFVIFAIICFFMIKYPFKNKEIYLYNNKVQQLKLIKEVLNKDSSVQNIVIATENDSQMLAINFLANEYKLFPLIKPHHFAELPTKQLINRLNAKNSVVIVQAQCYPNISHYFSTNQFKIITLNQFYSTVPNNPTCININYLKPLNDISSEWVYIPSHALHIV
jgi:hypothetical protein